VLVPEVVGVRVVAGVPSTIEVRVRGFRRDSSSED
jgi:hypothetical protein